MRTRIQTGNDSVISSTFLTEQGELAKKRGTILTIKMSEKIKKINLVSYNTLMISVANMLARKCESISVWCQRLECLKRVARL